MSKKSKVNHKEFVEMWNSDMHIREISKRIGLSLSATYEYAGRYRAECPRRNRLSEDSHNRRISMYKEGISITEISRELGVSKQAISRYFKVHEDAVV